MSETAKLARSAIGWATAFNLYRDVLQFATMLVLVRIVEPAAYGQFAQTTAAVGFIAVFSFNNFVAHVLQPAEIEPQDFQIHFTAGAMFQGFAFLSTNLVAFVLGAGDSAYAAIAGPMHVASVGFLLEWPCELRRRMLERDYRWRRLNLLHAVGITMASALGLGMGLAGFGVYALVGPGMLQTVPFIWDLFVTERWRPDWSWSRRRYLDAWRFGAKRTGSAIAIAGRDLVESSVITGVLGFQLLGIFNRALGLMRLLCARPAAILGGSVYPLLPRISADAGKRSRAGDLMLRAIGWVVVPAAALAALLAAPIVALLYGNRWLEVIPLLPWAMAYGVALAMVQTANVLLVAGQRAGTALFVDLIALGGTALGLWLALPWGAVAYLAFLLAALVVLLLALLVVLRQLGLASARGIVEAIGAPLLASAAGGALVAGVLPASMPGELLPTLGQLCTGAALFGATYLAVTRLLFGAALRELVMHAPGRRTVGRLLVFKDVR